METNQENTAEFCIEEQGFKAVVKWNPKVNRYYGTIYSTDAEDDPEHQWGGFASDTLDEVRPHFEQSLKRLSWLKQERRNNEAWYKLGFDSESISCFVYILPQKLRELIKAEKFDRSVLDKVSILGVDVPAYYATKAWDILMHDRDWLDIDGFMIGYDDDPDDEPEEDEEVRTRSFEEILHDNDEIIEILKNEFNIDIRSEQIDFSRFNMHLPPNVTEEEMDFYFEDVPYGVSESIFPNIPYFQETYWYNDLLGMCEYIAYYQRLKRSGYY